MCNHPLLFGTVSPTGPYLPGGDRVLVSNHPLLFGTVSPTREDKEWDLGWLKVTTPYCSGLSLLPKAVEVDRHVRNW